MRHLGFLLILPGFLVAGISGCTAPQHRAAPAPATVPAPAPAVTPKAAEVADTRSVKAPEIIDKRSPKEIFLDGLENLQAGEPEKAKILLERVLALDLEHAGARNLLPQIDADPVQALGKESFPYKVQPGDSLALIAKRYLGDAYKFYILAKYNGIRVPNRLEVGQSIKVPGKRPPLAQTPPGPAGTTEAPAATDTSELMLSEARRLHAGGHYQDAIKVLETTLHDEGGTAELKEFLATVYIDAARELANTARTAEARSLLTRALSVLPDDRRLKKQSELIGQQAGTEQTYQEGLRAVKAGSLAQAHEAFAKVLAAKPDHAAAKAKQAEIRPKVIEYYHRTATKAYRKHDMDEAIRNWDKVLEIDPHNALAKSNRAKAVELKERLEKLQ